MLNDIRYACRQLLKNPGFTAVALLSLALGIGANTALFSVVYGVIISPYPYARPQEIWTPGLRSPKRDQWWRSYSVNEYLELAKLRSFAEVMGTSGDSMLLTGEFPPESFQAVRLTASASRFLGVRPLIGRTIGDSDVRPSGEPEPVVVLSHGLWQRLFDGDPGALGRTLRLNDQPYTVIGVMPPRFGWYTSQGFWLPLGLDRRDSRSINPIVRLKPGVSQAAAEQELQSLHLALAKETPSAFPEDAFKSLLTNYMDMTVASGTMQTSLKLLFGAVALLLLIACANVANLQLARSSARAREMAVRLAIGAGRGRIVRQLLTESVLLSLLGGVLGLLFAMWMTNLMVSLMPSFYVPNEARVTVNGPVLVFCVIVSALTGIIFGLAPALKSSRQDLTEALKDATRGSGTAKKSGRLRELLVVAEVALSVVLLVSAGLTVRSFMAVRSIDLGFRPENVLLVDVSLNPKRYATLDQRNRFAQELVDRARSLPGVEAVSIGNGGLPFGGPQCPYAIDGQTDSDSRQIRLNLAGADYLKTIGIPLLRGRPLTEKEILGADHLVLINEAAAGLWPAGDDPLGKRLRLDLLEKPGDSRVLAPPGSSPYVTVVGIFGNIKNSGLSDPTQPVVVVPYTLLAPTQRTLAIRSRADPLPLMNPLRAFLREMDKEQPLGRPTTVEEVLGSETVQPRFVMALFGLFATLGLALAAAGIYSVLSFLVTRRTHEIGVRMALGARRGDVLGLVFRSGGRLVIAGLVIGLLGGFGAGRFLQSELFQVGAFDPVSCMGVVLALSTVAAAACYIPARRATKVDPLEALRYE